MNGLIPLGIPESELTQLLTSGLSLGDPPTPDAPASSGGALQIDFPKLVVDEEDSGFTSKGFAIPPGTTRITWQVIGTTNDVDLEASLDFTHFSVLDNASAAGVRSVQAGPTSLRLVINNGTGISVIVTCKREKL